MGRRKITAGPLDVAYVVERFALRDGKIMRLSTGEPATFTGSKNVMMVRVYHAGRVRRLVASRVPWACRPANGQRESCGPETATTATSAART